MHCWTLLTVVCLLSSCAAPTPTTVYREVRPEDDYWDLIQSTKGVEFPGKRLGLGPRNYRVRGMAAREIRGDALLFSLVANPVDVRPFLVISGGPMMVFGLEPVFIPVRTNGDARNLYMRITGKDHRPTQSSQSGDYRQYLQNAEWGLIDKK